MEKIIVCIKGVPKPESVKVDPETHTLKRESAELILNPHDKQALEMAVRLKKSFNTEIVAISMGPPNAIPILKYAYAIGCDKLILLCDKIFAGSDTLATSYILSQAIKKLSPFSLILMGLKSIDGETSQVPSETAALLDIPSITNVKSIFRENGKWIVVRENNYGEEEIEIDSPFVASISVKAFNYIKPPSLKRLIESENKEIIIWKKEDLELEPEKIGLKGSPTQVIGVYEKKLEIKGEIIEDEPSELAERLIKILEEKGVLRI